MKRHNFWQSLKNFAHRVQIDLKFSKLSGGSEPNEKIFLTLPKVASYHAYQN